MSLVTQEPNGWQRMGKRPGRVMWALAFMRVERASVGWRAWDVLRVPHVRATYPTTFHRTLKLAKERCERVVGVVGTKAEGSPR